MKAIKVTLKTLVVVAIFGVIALIFARIFLHDFWPGTTNRFYMPQSLYEKYSTNVDELAVYTQEPMAPYDDPKEGNFFMGNMFCAPNDGYLQVAVRYNESTLPKVEAFYKRVIEDPELAPLALFDFSLLVSYETESKDVTDFRRYTLASAECATDSLLMYRYARLAFENVDFDGAVWMRVDIYLKGTESGYTEENRFGSIVVYEDYEIREDAEGNQVKVDYPLSPYTLSKEEKRRG